MISMASISGGKLALIGALITVAGYVISAVGAYKLHLNSESRSRESEEVDAALLNNTSDRKEKDSLLVNIRNTHLNRIMLKNPEFYEPIEIIENSKLFKKTSAELQNDISTKQKNDYSDFLRFLKPITNLILDSATKILEGLEKENFIVKKEFPLSFNDEYWTNPNSGKLFVAKTADSTDTSISYNVWREGNETFVSNVYMNVDGPVYISIDSESGLTIEHPDGYVYNLEIQEIDLSEKQQELVREIAIAVKKTIVVQLGK